LAVADLSLCVVILCVPSPSACISGISKEDDTVQRQEKECGGVPLFFVFSMCGRDGSSFGSFFAVQAFSRRIMKKS